MSFSNTSIGTYSLSKTWIINNKNALIDRYTETYIFPTAIVIETIFIRVQKFEKSVSPQYASTKKPYNGFRGRYAGELFRNCIGRKWPLTGNDIPVRHMILTYDTITCHFFHRGVCSVEYVMSMCWYRLWVVCNYKFSINWLDIFSQLI